MNGLGRKNEEKEKQSVFTKETAGVILVLFSSLCLIFLITGDKVFGDLGRVISAFLYGVFGYFAFAVMLFGELEGVLFIVGKKISLNGKRKFLITLTAIFVVTFLHLISMRNVEGGYGAYIKAAYESAGDEYIGCSAGGVITAIYAYFFSLASVVGGCVILGLLTAICVYFFVLDVRGGVSNGQRSIKGSYIKTDNAKITESETESSGEISAVSTQTPATENSVGKPNGSQLYVVNAEGFGVKTKRDYKDKSAPSIKIDVGNNGFTVGKVDAPIREVQRPAVKQEDEFSKKLEYIKTPAQINLSREVPRQSSTVVSEYIPRREERKVEEPVNKVVEEKTEKEEISGVDIPMFEHDGDYFKRDNDFVKPSERVAPAKENESEVEQRARTFDEKYINVSEENTETPVEPDEIVRPVGEIEKEEQAEEIVESVEEVAEEQKEETPSYESQPETSNLTDRRVREILFGKEEEKPVVEEEKPAFESRIEKDGNFGFGRSISREAEEPKEEPVFTQEPVKEEVKPEKPPVPINREYFRPPLDLLETYSSNADASEENHDEKMEIIRKLFEDFHMNLEPQNYVQGPAITRYELAMPAGVSVKNILKYDDDLRMKLCSKNGVRIEAPIPGKDLIGVEVANNHRVTVGLKDIIEETSGNKSKPGALVFALGKDIEGKSITDNLAKGPHFLIAGTTGSGKSVCLNVMIVSLIMRYTPEELRFILVDPKRVGFMCYEHLPHLLIDEIISEPPRVLAALSWAYNEMERRYELFRQNTVSEIDAYNEKCASDTVPKMPRIVIIVDELADLMETSKKDMDARIRALAAKARAAGIHLVLATQRPSVDVITGVLKSNLPSRIALKVSSFNDSQTIIGEAGAEKLLGYGDMLYRSTSMQECERYQGAWISDSEVVNIVNYIVENNTAYFEDELKEFLDKETRVKQEESGGSDMGGDGESEGREVTELFKKALWLAVTSGTVSISQLQRRFQIGYARAGGLVDQMEMLGYISGNEGSKARKVLLTREDFVVKYGPMTDASDY